MLTAAPFVLRAKRVLVLTPSRLVREQLAENFASLVDLRKLEAMRSTAPSPQVCAVGRLVATPEEWEAFRPFDVVVATVPSVSPRPDAVATPPADLFDLVLVDEAHHSPARTWAALLKILAGARQVLFTATPFRRDEREIAGRIVFRYDIKRARDDGIFGEIGFQAVPRVAGENIDVTIAKAVAARFSADRLAGLKHLVMVRADTLQRAQELHDLYREHTTLRLEFVRGQHSLSHVRRILRKLDEGQADGIVCVNMFGEGFNLPALKIAGIHSPHKSLAVTLQFIGRFARRAGRDIGTATFLAEPHESSLELGALYEAGATWRDLVANLSDSRVEEEVAAREVIDSFDVEASLGDLEDFSLYTLRPYCHAKVYRIVGGVDLRATPAFPSQMEVVFSGVSDPHGAAIYITRTVAYPPWCIDDKFADVNHHVFIFHYNAEHELLFVCASRRRDALYEQLVEPMTLGRQLPLSSNAINRVLRGLQGLTVFSLGLRLRNPLGRTESYQQRSGGQVDRTVQEADARRYDRGHLYAKALDGGAPVTIGVSAASKLWRNGYLPIPQLLQLFDTHAAKIASSQPVLTSTGLDLLSPGEDLRVVPAGIVSAIWSEETYIEAPIAQYPNEDGEVVVVDLLDFELVVLDSTEGTCDFAVTSDEFTWTGRFEIGAGSLIRALDDREPLLYVGHEQTPIADYLCEALPSFYCSSLARVEGTSLFMHRGDVQPFDINRIESVDWNAAGVDTTSEKARNKPGSVAI